MEPGINIFSGERGLGGALTNPTELAKSKGAISRSYPVVVDGHHFPDAEAAYHHHKTFDREKDNAMLATVIALKFRQHPSLAQEVARRGGSAWLARCDHLTNAQSEGAKAWEGCGTESRFIQLLVRGYELACSDEELSLQAQRSLF